ncbi:MULTISPECIES: hypothetical protein [unclassified Flavobacterium]|uniref:hypothetical protein n=1 Tax=unclassified Flavobacterium TaxID=196869 RepID=UPI0025B97337|nr:MULTISPECIES: hypothetical protein [unclassified Flavobacterium]
MKTRFLFLMLFIASYCFSQSVNDYKAVIIPVKYDFLKTENQYRLQTLTKFNLEKAGFTAFYSNESIPKELSDRCNMLYVDVQKENAFLITKLFITLKDCYGTIVFQSGFGKSREKDFQVSYIEALNEAFQSVYALNYKYSGKTSTDIKSVPVLQSITVAAVPSVTTKKEVSESKISENKSDDLLYAQPTAYGYQLIDSEPKVVMKVYKTSNPASFMATKGSVQGVLVAKDNQWFFEYYQNDQLISEKVEVKF